MSFEYEIQIEDRTHKIEVRSLDEDGTLSIGVDDGVFTLKPIQNEDGTWTVSDASSEHVVKILKRTGTKLSIELDDQNLDVDWARAKKGEEAATVSTAVQGGKRVSGGVYPPMPGKITEVHVKVGESVDEGQTVCILEAMKMFNELKAPMKGTVKEVNIEPGSSVSNTDLLILIS
jgi:biotin carboxyl carrier protein